MPSPIWKGTTALLFQPDSGRLSMADRVTFTDVYKGPDSVCRAGLLRRGTYGSGERDGWVVTSSVVEPDKGTVSKLTINWEAGGPSASSIFLPLSEFDSQVVELYPKIERAGFFADITRDTLSAAYSAVLGATKAQRDAAWSYLNGLDDPQKTLGLKLVQKLQNGEESWYVAGMRYMFIYYSFSLPTLSLGGFIETPSIAASVGLGSMSWLRLADFFQSAGVNGSAYRVTQTWLGGPEGHWDTDIYS
jgi:hypothetical protein